MSPVHGRRATVALALTVVLGTALLLWAAEWLARAGAESVLARAVQEQTGVLARPTVQVHGSPVLLQALRGRYDDVEVDGGTVSSGPVRLRAVEAELSGVYLSFHDLLDGNTDEVFVERSVERALLTHDDLDRYLRFTSRRLRRWRGGGTGSASPGCDTGAAAVVPCSSGDVVTRHLRRRGSGG